MMLIATLFSFRRLAKFGASIGAEPRKGRPLEVSIGDFGAQKSVRLETSADGLDR